MSKELNKNSITGQTEMEETNDKFKSNTKKRGKRSKPNVKGKGFKYKKEVNDPK